MNTSKEIKLNEEISRQVLCWNCGEVRPYTIKGRESTRIIRGKEYVFHEKYAVCNQCGEEIYVPGLSDENERVFENAVRRDLNRITTDEIELLLETYDIDKRPLSRLLGLGELTISRYLEGQFPSLRYSELLRGLLKDPTEMKRALGEGAGNISETTYRKVDKRVDYLIKVLSINDKISALSRFVIDSKYDITNLSLQKLLYLINGVSMGIRDAAIFDDVCEAWAYGPVYPHIYEKYKSFGRSEISFDINKDNVAIDQLLSNEEKKLADYVLDCFAIYNGHTLVEISHRQTPWIRAREGLDESARCNNPILNEWIKEYFKDIYKKYRIDQKAGMRDYIDSLGLI